MGVGGCGVQDMTVKDAKVSERHKSEEYIRRVGSIKMSYEGREKVIKSFDDYYSMMSEAKYQFM